MRRTWSARRKACMPSSPTSRATCRITPGSDWGAMAAAMASSWPCSIARSGCSRWSSIISGCPTRRKRSPPGHGETTTTAWSPGCDSAIAPAVANSMPSTRISTMRCKSRARRAPNCCSPAWRASIRGSRCCCWATSTPPPATVRPIAGSPPATLSSIPGGPRTVRNRRSAPSTISRGSKARRMDGSTGSSAAGRSGRSRPE